MYKFKNKRERMKWELAHKGYTIVRYTKTHAIIKTAPNNYQESKEKYNMEKGGYTILAGVILLVLLVCWLFLWVPIFGLHYETSRGEHTGYLTAVQKQGVFFKTGRAYVKTDTQSSQEDTYCVTDPDVFAQLQQLSLRKAHVNLFYFGWFSAGIANCEAEGEIIYKVDELK